MRPLLILLALALLFVPLVWMIPISETCGWNQCLFSAAEVGLTLFLYYLLWGWTVSHVRQRGGGAAMLWDTIWYINLPITLVYIYRATNWHAAFTCN
jgi:hypothetical protein